VVRIALRKPDYVPLYRVAEIHGVSASALSRWVRDYKRRRNET